VQSRETIEGEVLQSHPRELDESVSARVVAYEIAVARVGLGAVVDCGNMYVREFLRPQATMDTRAVQPLSPSAIGVDRSCLGQQLQHQQQQPCLTSSSSSWGLAVMSPLGHMASRSMMMVMMMVVMPAEWA